MYSSCSQLGEISHGCNTKNLRERKKNDTLRLCRSSRALEACCSPQHCFKPRPGVLFSVTNSWTCSFMSANRSRNHQWPLTLVLSNSTSHYIHCDKLRRCSTKRSLAGRNVGAGCLEQYSAADQHVQTSTMGCLRTTTGSLFACPSKS